MAENTASHDLDRIRKIATAYKSSIAVGTAVRLGIFTEIGDAAVSADELAARLNTRCDGLTRLLNALVSMNLLHKDSGKFRNSPVAMRFLVKGQPEYQGGYIEYVYDIMHDWLSLEERIRFGDAPRTAYEQVVGADSSKTRDFMAAMHANALPNAEFLTALVDFSNVGRILDLGCGAGTYSIAIAARHHHIHCDLVDLPAIAAIAKANVEAAGVDKRINVIPGNYSTDDLPTGYDVVLLLAVIHQESPDDVARLLKKVSHSLVQEGRLILSTFVLDEDQTAPAFSVIFSLEMLVLKSGGRAYTFRQIADLLTNNGFGNVRILSGSQGTATFIEAVKK